ncbi:MAG: hypothetical protein IJV91_03535 [Kiritimatiellae bacterium]|nr:hypothetical protein [Kiritimatiellia bacterium]
MAKLAVNGNVYDIRNDRAGRGFIDLMTGDDVPTMTVGEAIGRYGLSVEEWDARSGAHMVRVHWRDCRATEYGHTSLESVRSLVRPVSCC